MSVYGALVSKLADFVKLNRCRKKSGGRRAFSGGHSRSRPFSTFDRNYSRIIDQRAEEHCHHFLTLLTFLVAADDILSMQLIGEPVNSEGSLWACILLLYLILV